MLFMSEVNPQITFARTKIILARAIFDEIHGVRSNLHGLPGAQNRWLYGSVPDPFLER